jgi:hypothetical protein
MADWDGGMVGWWDGGIVGLWDGGMVGWRMGLADGGLNGGLQRDTQSPQNPTPITTTKQQTTNNN